jgi:hypothetical protein
MSWFRQENTENRWNMGAVFRLKNFRIFLDDFWSEYWLPCSRDFQCFPASFLRDPVAGIFEMGIYILILDP